MTSNWTLNEKSTGVLEVTVEGDAWKKAQNKALKKIRSKNRFLKKHYMLKLQKKSQTKL